MPKILIVDDDSDNREILRARLQKGGYEILEAINGTSGLDAARTQNPDLVILDVMMPKMDGWQVCRALRDDPKTKALPVIMLTAKNQQIEEMRGWESGANEYVTKPIDYDEFMRILSKFFPIADEKGISHG